MFSGHGTVTNMEIKVLKNSQELEKLIWINLKKVKNINLNVSVFYGHIYI